MARTLTRPRRHALSLVMAAAFLLTAFIFLLGPSGETWVAGSTNFGTRESVWGVFRYLIIRHTAVTSAGVPSPDDEVTWAWQPGWCLVTLVFSSAALLGARTLSRWSVRRGRLRERCDECGYDLRAATGSVCPECGTRSNRP